MKQLFEWILPPLLDTVSTCEMAAPVSYKNIVQCSLELFEILLMEALPNLKERKYLRGWIQVLNSEYKVDLNYLKRILETIHER